MPTGYTADIAAGITFKTYAMHCARAFGALVHMRVEPSTYHADQLREAQERMDALEQITPEEASRNAWATHVAATNSWTAAIDAATKLKEKYQAMLAQVNAWAPPSTDHSALKAFMADQIVTSISGDCNIDYYLSNPPIELTGAEWLKKEKELAQWNIDYHTKETEKEARRNSSRNEWLQQLLTSLETSP